MAETAPPFPPETTKSAPPEELSERERNAWMAAIAALVAALFRLPRLGIPNEEIFDEVYHAKTALQYLNNEAVTEWVHPPTAKLLIAIGVYFFGYESWAWRLMPAIAGILLAVSFFYLARTVLETERAAILATGLLLCDGVYLVQSRTAMTNIFAVLFQVTAALLVLRGVMGERMRARYMLPAGVALGLALSTRWTSLWAWGFLGLVMLAFRWIKLFRPRKGSWAGRDDGLEVVRELGLTVATFFVIPVMLYWTSYTPWMIHEGYLNRQTFSSREGRAHLWNGAFHRLPELQRAIWEYHSNLRAEHPYFSAWYTWPLLKRPTWYYFRSEPEPPMLIDRVAGLVRPNEALPVHVRGIIALGNPVLWWVSLPIALVALVTGLHARDWRRIFAGVGYFLLYLPWGISPRQLNYSHYLFEAIPYACLALGFFLDRGWNGRAAPLARGYFILVAIAFAYFLPFLLAWPVPGDWFFNPIVKDSEFRAWAWFRSWI